MKMSTCTHESMRNHYGSGCFAQIGQTLRLWRDRQLERRRLAELTDRDLHDVGLSRADIFFEAEKPFWRAGTPPGRRRLLRGAPTDDFSRWMEPSNDRASTERPPATFRRLVVAQRKIVDGALCRAARCGRIAGLLPVALGPLALQPLPRRHERTAADRTRSFRPRRRGRPL